MVQNDRIIRSLQSEVFFNNCYRKLLSIPTLDRSFISSLSLPTLSTISLSDTFFFFNPILIVCRRSLSLPLIRNTDPGSHSRLLSSRTHYGSCLAFLSRDDFGSFLPRRLARTGYTHARRSQQLILSFWRICSESHHGRTRTHGLPLAAFESYN